MAAKSVRRMPTALLGRLTSLDVCARASRAHQDRKRVKITLHLNQRAQKAVSCHANGTMGVKMVQNYGGNLDFSPGGDHPFAESRAWTGVHSMTTDEPQRRAQVFDVARVLRARPSAPYPPEAPGPRVRHGAQGMHHFLRRSSRWTPAV